MSLSKAHLQQKLAIVKPPPRRKKRPSRALAAEVERWRIVCANAQKLSKTQTARLASFQWPPGRVRAAADLIEALVQTEAVQLTQMQVHRTEEMTAGELQRSLRAWYKVAARQIKRAIKNYDPHNQQQYRSMLGL